MFGKVLFGLLLLVGVLAMYINSRPGPFRVSRSMSMLAPPAPIMKLRSVTSAVEPGET